MRGRDRLLKLGALAVSVMIHAALFFHAGSIVGNSDIADPLPHVTRVSFQTITVPLSQAEIQPPEEPLPSTESPIQERVEPAEPVEPKPAREKAPDRPPQPIESKPSTSPSLERSNAPASMIAKEETRGTVADPALIAHAKEEYLRRLMAHIESYKRYPSAARRRGIEGDVNVAFKLEADGGVSDLDTTGAHRVLLSAASDALEEAEPMPLPPDTFKFPWEVSFTMQFTLR